jgi:hypothetical protein
MSMDPVCAKLRDQAVMSSPTRCQRIGFGDGGGAVSPDSVPSRAPEPARVA